MYSEFDDLLTISEASRMLGVSPSTLRRLEKDGYIEGYGLRVIYTPGGQRRYVLDEVKQLYSKQGFAGELGIGTKPALLIRDMTVAFTMPHSQLAVQIKDQIKVVSNLIDVAAEKNVPIIFSNTIYDANVKASKLWGKKFPYLQILDKNSTWVELHPELADKPYDLIYKNVYISDFYKSPLPNFLKEREVDTIILAGTSTSGSIRTTAIDALQHNYQVIIPKEAVGDRTHAIQTFTLMDLNARYADVVSVNKVIEYLQKLDKKS